MDNGEIIFNELNQWVYTDENQAGDKLLIIDASDLPVIIPEIVKKLNIQPVMPSFVLDELRARAKVYQNNYYSVGLDEVERNGWYNSWKAMDEAIYIIEHPSKTNEA